MPHFFLAALQQSDTAGEEAIKQAIASTIANSAGRGGPFGWPGALVPIVSTGGFWLVLGLIGWLLYRRSQTRLQARTEFHRQLLDKFTSGGEFAGFLNSSGGQRLLEDLWSQGVNAKERIIRSTRGGVVLTVLGLGALMVRRTLVVPGVLVLTLGVGLLISAAISYQLSKKFGLLEERHGSGDVASHSS